MRVAILDLTTHQLPLLSGICRAGKCIEDWISRGFSDAKFEIFDIAGGMEKVPSMKNFNALIVSGSERSVYDRVSWHVDVSNVLNETRKMGKPIFGICYGHQIMAATFGGDVRRSSRHDSVGVRKFVQRDGHAFNRFVWHHDQVIRPPDCATLVASSDYCPFASLEYSFQAFSVQYHPEFTKEYFKKLLMAGEGIFLSSKQTQRTLTQIKKYRVPRDADLKKITDLLSDNSQD